MRVSTPNLFSTKTDIVCRINKKPGIRKADDGRPVSRNEPQAALVNDDHAHELERTGPKFHRPNATNPNPIRSTLKSTKNIRVENLHRSKVFILDCQADSTLVKRSNTHHSAFRSKPVHPPGGPEKEED